MIAPERIWVDAEYLTNPKRSLEFRNNVTHVQGHALAGEVEYIRADLAPTAPKVKALVEAARPFADIGVSENPDYRPTIRLDRDAIIALRAALAALEGGDA